MHWWTTKKFLYICCVTLKNFIFKRQQMKANIHQISKNLWKRQYQSKKLLKQKPILLKGVNSFNLSGFLTDGLTKMKTQGLNKYIKHIFCPRKIYEWRENVNVLLSKMNLKKMRNKKKIVPCFLLISNIGVTGRVEMTLRYVCRCSESLYLSRFVS